MNRTRFFFKKNTLALLVFFNILSFFGVSKGSLPNISNARAQNSSLQADGKIVVSGAGSVNNGTEFLTLRYNIDGTLDTTFGTSGVVISNSGNNSQAFSNAIQTDGKIVVAGVTTSSVSQIMLVRYTTAGVLDTTFGFGGIVVTPAASGASGRDVAIQSDGKIVVVGTAIVSGQQEFITVRYNTNGSIDTSFGTGGMVITPNGVNAQASGVAIQSNGDIVVVGYTRLSSNNVFTIMRYSTAGVLDATFGVGGKVNTTIGSNAQAQSIAVQTDGKLLVAGFSDSNSVMARYTTAGILDVTFNGTGLNVATIGSTSQIWDVEVQPADGKSVYSGYSGNNFLVARLTTAGVFDPTFGTNGIVLTSIQNPSLAYSLNVQTDTNLVAAGVSDSSCVALARYTTVGNLDTTFGNNGIVQSLCELPTLEVTQPVALTDDTQSTNCSNGALTILGGVGVQGNFNLCGLEHIFNTGASNNCSNGALVVDGGMGVGGNLNVCGTVTALGGFTGPGSIGAKGATGNTGAAGVTGNTGIAGTRGSTGSTGLSGSTGPTGAVGATGATGTLGFTAPNLTITGINASTNCSNGALVVAGGVGIAGNLNVCGAITTLGGFSGPGGQITNLNASYMTGATGIFNSLTVNNLSISGPLTIPNTTQSSACTNGALVTAGGAGIGGNLNVCGTETIFNTAASNSTTNGALVVVGGAGIGGNLNVGGTGLFAGPVVVNNAAASTNCSNGALTVAGGVGIAGNLNVCGTIIARGGVSGVIGSTGATGNTGAVGNTGATGSSGLVGSTGPTGAAGATGATGTIGLIVPNLTITGTAGSANPTSGALIVAGGAGIAGNLNVGGTGSFAGPVAVNNTNPSTNCSNGALTIGGGVGIAGDLNVCGQITTLGGFSGPGGQITNLNASYMTGNTGIFNSLTVNNLSISGPLSIPNATQSNACTNGALVAAGGAGIGGNLNVCGTETIFNMTASNSPTNGALVVAGGAGVGGNLNVGGTGSFAGPVAVNNANPSTNCSNGALTIGGGVGIAGDLNVCGQITTLGGFSGPGGQITNLNASYMTGNTGIFNSLTVNNLSISGPLSIPNATQSNACTNGALVAAGGAGIGGNLNVCGTETIFNMAASSSPTNGALVVAGGAGIGGNLNVGGTGSFAGPLLIISAAASTSCSNGALAVAGGVGIAGNLNVCGVITSLGGFSGPGTIGATGATGNTGVLGATGVTGNQGAVGATGATGSSGLGGSTGATGAVGATGATGTIGLIVPNLTITGITASTNATNGALIVAGGAGIGGNLNVGGTGTIAGPLIVNNTNQSTSCSNGAFTVGGGAGIAGNLNVCGLITALGGFSGPGIVGTTGATGSAGVTGAVGATGATGALGNTGATGLAGVTGATGSVGLTVPNFTITGTTSSTNCSNGSLIVGGGAGVAGNLNVCGVVSAQGGFSGAGAISGYGYYYNPSLNLTLAILSTTPVPIFVDTGASTSAFTVNNSTTLQINNPGTYVATYIVQATIGVSLLATGGELRVNGTTVPGSQFNLAALSAGQTISGQAIFTTSTANALLQLVDTSLIAVGLSLSGTASLIIEKIA